MNKPSDIPQFIWDNLNHDLKITFSRDSNRSFINPVIKQMNEELEKCIILNKKINTYSSKLKALTIRYIVEVDKNADDSMALVQQSLVDSAHLSKSSISDFKNELSQILDNVKSRVKFYEDALNGS
jgi:bifunctional DNase/RNase